MKPAVHLLVPVLALACALLAGVGCSERNDSALQPLPGPVVETVNGQAVPQALLDALARGRNLDLSQPDQYAQALKELTEYVLLAEEARRENLAADSAFAAGVELTRLQGVANATLGEFQRAAKIDDRMLKAAYEDQIARSGKVEYDFGQLLFATEAEALKAEAEILSGKPFSEVFDEHGKDARQARAFSGVRKNQLPEPLARALESLQPGQTGKVPVQTKFGWHVVHLTATHPFTPPGFDALKAGIRRTLLTQLAEQRLAKLRDEAKITVHAPAPKAATPAAGDQAPAASAPAQPAATGDAGNGN
ncbi:MAG TPA: peptidyl-prolyl cis-trans isomerase [Rhodanobacteraceae bacterium]|nr:peptidyl-prolyl cis-trans isomerase [Rhodanobacteraceae bacterium]